MKKLYFLIFAFCIVTLSCSNDDQPKIDPQLQEFFDRFKEEGANRGVEVDYEALQLNARLVGIITSGVLGQCVRIDNAEPQIDIEKGYWETADDIEREFVIFHELGHCVLNRDHLNTPDMDGNCLSLMYNGFSPECILNYNTERREELLDELFGN